VSVFSYRPARRHSGGEGQHNPKKLLYSLMLTPPFIAPRRVDDPVSALAQVRTVYEHAIAHLRTALERFIAGEDLFQRVRAYYPYVRVRTDTVARADSRLSYGFVAGPGIYETTLTRPDLFGAYYLEQFRLLVENHHVSLEVGTSKQPMPVHFSLPEDEYIEATMVAERRLLMRDLFDLPDLYAMDDGIANGTFEPEPGEPRPLALFNAPRVDYSLHRLRHYTATAPEHFQNFVLFTNYQFYIDESVRLRHALMSDPNQGSDEYTRFVEPSNLVTRRAGEASEPGMRSARCHRACRRCPPTTLCGTIALVSRWSISASGPATPRPSPTTSRYCVRMPGSCWATAPVCGRRSSLVTTYSRMVTCARITCSTRMSRCGCRSRRLPKCSSRSKERSQTSRN
jgi:AMP nucleosidase